MCTTLHHLQSCVLDRATWPAAAVVTAAGAVDAAKLSPPDIHRQTTAPEAHSKPPVALQPYAIASAASCPCQAEVSNAALGITAALAGLAHCIGANHCSPSVRLLGESSAGCHAC